MQKVNILLLTDEMLPGGVSRHVVDVANGLKKKNIDVTVAATDGIFRKRLNDDIPFYELSLLQKNSFKKNPIGFFSSYYRLSHLLTKQKFSIIHTHKRYSDLLGRTLAKKFHVKHISSCHNTFHNLRFLPSFGKEYTISCTNVVRNIIIQDYGKLENRVKTVYYGIAPFSSYSIDEKYSIRKQYGFSPETPIFTCIARMEKSKDHATLLQAISLVRNNFTQEFFVILVGDGNEKEEMIALSKKLNIEKCVSFLEGTTNVEKILNISDFCCISSIRDGGILYVVLEAASLGKPHIATSVGGIPEFITHNETGLLVEPKNPQQLAEQIMYLLQNPKEVQRLGENAKRKYEQHFTHERMMNEIISVYQKTLDL